MLHFCVSINEYCKFFLYHPIKDANKKIDCYRRASGNRGGRDSRPMKLWPFWCYHAANATNNANANWLTSHFSLTSLSSHSLSCLFSLYNSLFLPKSQPLGWIGLCQWTPMKLACYHTTPVSHHIRKIIGAEIMWNSNCLFFVTIKNY